MTYLPDPLPRALRSLPLAILLGTAVSAIAMPFLHWLAVLILRYPPNPPGPVWVDYVAIRALSGAGVGAAMYAVGRLPNGWLRWCLLWTLFFLLVEGDLPDFISQSLQDFLEIWALSSLGSGPIVGTVFHVLDRRARARKPADRTLDDAR